jgi:hypothetical protein
VGDALGSGASVAHLRVSASQQQLQHLPESVRLMCSEFDAFYQQSHAHPLGIVDTPRPPPRRLQWALDQGSAVMTRRVGAIAFDVEVSTLQMLLLLALDGTSSGVSAQTLSASLKCSEAVVEHALASLSDEKHPLVAFNQSVGWSLTEWTPAAATKTPVVVFDGRSSSSFADSVEAEAAAHLVAQRQQRWAAKESAENAAHVAREWSAAELRQRVQIIKLNPVLAAGWSTFRVLSAELAALMASTAIGPHISVEAVDDNVHHWSIRFSARGFAPQSEFAQRLASTAADPARAHVEVHLKFDRDLYPAVPPSLRLVRPRLANGMLGRLAFFAPLQAAKWNPARRMADVINAVHRELVAHGKF